jgi:CheY-like chemotaxis protein
MEAIGTIASGVAHNFRNVLSGISVNNQLVEMKYQGDRVLMAIMEKVNNAVDRGARLVDGLMQFARKDGTKDFKPLNLAELIQEVFDLTRKSFDKKIDIRVNIPGSISVIGDHSGLTQVLMNLCVNARDAMPDGGKLRIEARRKENMAEITVSDTGHGMDKEALERCFDPFFTSKEVGKGTGLGLSTSYRIIKDHEGDIQAYSEVGKGAVFKIYLPVASESECIGTDSIKDLIRGSGQRILIVDDEVDILAPMEDLLEGMGYHAAFASDGTEAIAKYFSWQPDAVLMDRNMPDMDGITCSKKIIEKDPQARIILISGYDEKGPDGIDLQTREMIFGYLTKPITIIELNDILYRLFSSKQPVPKPTI